MQFSSILPIDSTLLLPVRVELGAMAMKGYTAFPKLQYDWNLTIILLSVISMKPIGEVLLLCRYAVGVFYSPRRLSKSLDVIAYFQNRSKNKL